MKKLLNILIILLIMFSLHAQEQKITLPLRFDHYYTYDQVNEALKLLNKAYPEITKLDLVGKSDENREIWALTVNNPKTGKELDKPGVYVDGNIHGNEIQAGEVCLYLAEYLLKNFGKNDKITKILNKNAYYILPVVNVDGRYHFFADGNTMHSNRSLRQPKDDDNDGLLDEDFPDDLDGDGNICQMRIKDEYGNLKTDPEDPRNMIRVKPGEKGEWRMLGSEGVDNDDDGKINEDAEGYVDPNRTWGYNWQPDYVQNGAGSYPFAGPGIKAIANYLKERPNIIVVYAFHNYGGMFLRGPSTKSEGELNSKDVEVYDYLGDAGEKIVPGYKYLISWKDLYATYGDFTDFTQNVFGAYSFTGELFQREQETFSKNKPDAKEDEQPGTGRRSRNDERDRELLKFNDQLGGGILFKEWTKFKHPVYGEIEIGGWVKFSSRMPHPFMLPDLVHRNAMAVLFTAEQTPEIEMNIIDKTKVGKDLSRIRVRLYNKKSIPSMSYHAVSKNLYVKDILKLTGPKAKVVAGGQIKDMYNYSVSYKEYKPEIQFIQVPANGTVEYEFLVSGNGSFTIEYKSQKAGVRKVEGQI